MKNDEQIVKAIRLTWSSLESHLKWTYAPIDKHCREVEEEDNDFHKKCVKEYAEIIKILSDLL